MMRTVVTIEQTGDAVVSSPYDEAFIAELKDAIPYRRRSWDRDDKVWWVDADYAFIAIEICERHFGDVAIQDLSVRKEAGATHDPDYTELYLLPEAPWPIVDAAYRQLARMYHPDTGGDTAAMQRINVAFDRIRQRRAV